MFKPNLLVLTGSLSPKHNGGMGIATEALVSQLGKITPIQLIKSSDEKIPSVAREYTLYAISPTIEVTQESKFSTYSKEVLNLDFLISPYTTEKTYKKTLEKTALGATSITTIETEALQISFLERIAQYNQKIVALAKTLSFDFIYCKDWVTFQAGITLKLLTGKKLIVHLHSLESDRNPNEENPSIHYLEGKAMDYADLVITVSQYTKDTIQKNYSTYPGKIKVLYPGLLTPLALKKKYHTKNAINLLFMGRLSPQKGVENFIAIAELVLASQPTTHILIAGDGPLKAKIETLIQASEYASQYKLLGYVEGDKKKALLQKADILCMPSYSEPFGLVALEAAALGVPCVVSKKSGFAEISKASPSNTPEDIKGFAENILLLSKNATLRGEIAADQLNDVSKLDWAQSAIDFIHYLK